PTPSSTAAPYARARSWTARSPRTPAPARSCRRCTRSPETERVQFAVLPVTPFQQNCSLVWCEATGQAALIDPGGEPARLLAAVEERDLTLTRLLLTHGHVDHVGAAAPLAERLGIPIEGP